MVFATKALALGLVETAMCSAVGCRVCSPWPRTIQCNLPSSNAGLISQESRSEISLALRERFRPRVDISVYQGLWFPSPQSQHKSVLGFTTPEYLLAQIQLSSPKCDVHPWRRASGEWKGTRCVFRLCKRGQGNMRQMRHWHSIGILVRKECTLNC